MADVQTVHYMGCDYEIDADAVRAVRIQRAMANADRDAAAAFDAMDAVMCGKLDEACMTIPEEDGEVGEYGASTAALGAFFSEAGEQIGVQAKN